jgi:hypothetical protein
VIQSMFNLDHRIAELRPSADEARAARQLRDASTAAQQATVVTVRRRFEPGFKATRLSRAAAG